MRNGTNPNGFAYSPCPSSAPSSPSLPPSEGLHTPSSTNSTASAPPLPSLPSLQDLHTPRSSIDSTFGPENGHLVIIGGNLRSESIFQRIISLAGGFDASIIVIPTAKGRPIYNDNHTIAAVFRSLGATSVTVLHTQDPTVADTEEFVAPLKNANAVFFTGGRPWRLVDAYAGTKAEWAFNDVLRRGGVISGTSAGASIMGSFLARGDTSSNRILVGDHTIGFGFLKNAVIDSHALVRNRQFDMFQIVEVRLELPSSNGLYTM